MLVLVLLALVREGLPRPGIAWLLVVAALVWAVVSGLDQLKTRGADPLWITAGDTLLAGFALVAPAQAGSEDLFYGGFPAIAVAVASATGRRRGWVVAVVLSLVTVVRLGVVDLPGFLASLSQLVSYVMVAGIVGWAVHVIHFTEDARLAAEDARARAEERTAVAAHLHDSVLQTLALIQREPGDPQRVASLARRQEADLRSWLYGPGGNEASGLAAALASAAAEVDERFGVNVEVVTVGDAILDERTAAVAAAAREAMTNAAKHSGASSVAVFLEAGNPLRVFVRDRGKGFDPESVPADRHGIADSIRARMEAVGGQAVIRSGDGTEVRLEVDL
jgi:signal transduction histidine kinase